MRQKIRRFVAMVAVLLFPVTFYYFSPVVSLAGLASGIVSGSILLFGILLAGATVTGRLFCSWVCPAGAIQDGATPLRRRRIRCGLWIKYVLWTPWVAVGIILLLRAGGVRAVEPFYMTVSGVSLTEPAVYIVYFSVIVLFLGLSLVFGRRAGCHYVCWMAPFMIAGRKTGNALRLPAFRLTARSESCTACRTCTAACPMSLDVYEMVRQGRMEQRNCILCAQCADGCPSGTIRMRFTSAPDRRDAT